MRRLNFLEYRNYRFLKLACLLAGAACVASLLPGPSAHGPHAGAWFGYGLGIASAALVLLLCWYGIRKRSAPRDLDRRKASRRWPTYAAAPDKDNRRHDERRKTRPEDHWRYGGSLQGWLSAHVYLGILLIVLASLHSGFRFAWNIHSLVYALVLLVVGSGLYGTFAYLRHPRLIAENLGEDTLSGLLLKIEELDELARIRALALPDEVNAVLAVARQRTRLGGGLLRQLGCGPGTCATEHAVQALQELGKQLVAGEQPRQMRDLHAVLLQKQRLLARACKAIALDARMRAWLYLHAPLSVALLAALLAHVMVILVFG